MNECNFIGRMTKDPVLRTTPTGKSVATVSLAIPRQYEKDKTDFIDVVIWGQLAENVSRYTRKGSKVAIHGNLQMRRYTDKNGFERTTNEIVAQGVEFLDPKEKPEPAPEPAYDPAYDDEVSEYADDESLPF